MKKITLAFVLVSIVWIGVHFANSAYAISNSECQSECQKCASVCSETLKHCNMMGGKHAQPEHVMALKDCVALCKQSAHFIERNSELKNKLCAICQEACNTCAKSCGAFKDDKDMQACAQECRKCAESCQSMIKQG